MARAYVRATPDPSMWRGAPHQISYFTLPLFTNIPNVPLNLKIFVVLLNFFVLFVLYTRLMRATYLFTPGWRSKSAEAVRRGGGQFWNAPRATEMGGPTKWLAYTIYLDYIHIFYTLVLYELVVVPIKMTTQRYIQNFAARFARRFTCMNRIFADGSGGGPPRWTCPPGLQNASTAPGGLGEILAGLLSLRERKNNKVLWDNLELWAK